MTARASEASPKRKPPAKKRGVPPKRKRQEAKPPSAPVVQLGALAPNGIAASLFALVERGAGRHPRLARSTRGIVELRFDEDFAPVRIEFAPSGIVVRDVTEGRSEKAPDLTVGGSLPHLVQLAAAPLIGGMPNPAARGGRAALGRFAAGRVRIEGRPLLARRLLKLLEI